jgi:hypothetical protein
VGLLFFRWNKKNPWAGVVGAFRPLHARHTVKCLSTNRETTTTIAMADHIISTAPTTDPMTDPDHRADHRKCRTAHFTTRFRTYFNTSYKTRGADSSPALVTSVSDTRRDSDNRRRMQISQRPAHTMRGNPEGSSSSSSSFAQTTARARLPCSCRVFNFDGAFGAAAESWAPRTRRRGNRAAADARAPRTGGRGRNTPSARSSPSPTIRVLQLHKPPPPSSSAFGPCRQRPRPHPVH